MESARQGEGHPFVAQTVEGAPSAPAMDEKGDHGTTPARSTRAAMKKVCPRKLGSMIQQRLDH